MKKILLGLFIGFISLLCVKNTYAVSDLTGTLTSTVSGSTSFAVCNSPADCSSYRYIIFEPVTSNFYYNSVISLVYQATRNVCRYYPYYSERLVCSFDSSIAGSFLSISAGNVETNMTFKYTLTENSPFEGGSTPAPEPCPDPEENSQYMNVVLDSFWKYHAAFGGAVVAIIVIFFVYRLIKGVMR